MNTKEAIRYLDELQDAYSELQEENDNKKILEVIGLLKRGEKYEQMWEEFIENLRRDIDTEKFSGHTLEHILSWYKEKYFPEPVKKTITIDKDLLPDLAKEITKCFREWIKDHLVRDLPITPSELTILSDSIIKGIENSVKNIKEGD